MMASLYEKRPLKKPRIGPPDVYPQEPRQKEDELTSTNVKHGFNTTSQLTDEFGSARNSNITASKVGAYFNAIIARKEELSTLQDCGRKRQQINPKDNFWPAIVRNKQSIEAWFKDLAGTKSLMQLGKRAPNFNKKEEIFIMLAEYQVPLLRAAWFLKLSSAYTIAVSEAKNKKRQLPDPTTEWTATLIKFLKDQLPKLHEHYNQNPESNKSTISCPMISPNSNLSVSSASVTAPPLHSPTIQNSIITNSGESDFKVAFKNWTYGTQLAKYIYEEGLIDRQEFLNWIMELLDKLKLQTFDDGILKLLLPLTLQYLNEFILSELLSRRLAYLCAKKISYMCNNPTNQNDKENSNSPSREVKTDEKKENPFHATIKEYLNCPHHRELILQLSCILQVITLECPTAMVWCGVGDGKITSVWNGSPFDILPLPPSQLPLPPRNATFGIPSSGMSNGDLVKRLKHMESLIKERSRRAHGHWCVDKWQSSQDGIITARVLAALDALDRHRFDKVDNNNSLDNLYLKIFSPMTKETANNSENKEPRGEYNVNQDEAIVQILCEWTVSYERWGEHRAMAVAWLLDKRQNDVNAAAEAETTVNDDKDSTGSFNNGLPIFQPLLMKFLDNDAPVLEENGSAQNRATFTNLIHLFAELIRHEVFSHDAYMCTLISRGDLFSSISNTHRALTPPTNPNLEDDVFGIDLKPTKIEDHVRTLEYDDSKIDDDLDKILQHIKEDQQNSMDAPDSPKDPSDAHHHTAHHGNIMPHNVAGMGMNVAGISSIGMEHSDLKPTSMSRSRHLLYTTHFPLPQDEYSQHDCNQRHVLLYGFGKVRDEARHTVKKMSKEICKLFSKKFSIDVAEGGKVKKHSRSEFNFEATTQKCQSLSYFDQHVVTWQCSVTVIEMLNGFAQGNSNYLPVQEHVAFLFDLMELALNIHGLIDVCIQILKELPEVEAQLMAKNSALSRVYTTSLSLYVVGVLRRYHCCLLLSSEQTSAVFEGLCRVVKHVSNPGDCSSAERCILAHLYDLYSSHSMLKSKQPHNSETSSFGNAYPKIRQALYASLQPNQSNSGNGYNLQYMQEILMNPRRGGKIESSCIRSLAESASNRFSFVTNALICVCRENDNEKLNDLAIMCAEITACCNALSSEWVAALMTLCCSNNHGNIYTDLFNSVDVQDLSIHNSLAIFTSILIARHCFSLEEFVKHCALPSLVKVKAFNEGRIEGIVNGDYAEAGARLTCHLLLRLFKTVESPQPSLYSVSTSPHPMPAGQANSYNLRLSCDRHLLAAAHNNIKVGPVLAVLKAILVVGDATARESRSINKRDGSAMHSVSSGSKSGELSISHILGTSDMLGGADEAMLDLGHSTPSSENTATLSSFAWHVLREICSQQWVLERCLSQPEELCHDDMLLDSMLTSSQAQRLLHMICYPEISSTLDELDQKSYITRVLENLDQWTLRMSWLDLQLMFRQFNNNNSELNQWLDTVAKAAIDVFELNSSNDKTFSKLDSKHKSGSIWLVAPLISKLPSAVQGRVLKVAGQVLETNNWPVGRRNSSHDSNTSHSRVMNKRFNSLLGHQPFLSLVLTCLKGQDDQREGLLTSLHNQLSQFLSLNVDERVGTCEIGSRESMLDALQLRFSLLGGMFDTIQRMTATTTDWAVLLVQLISYGIIDLNNNCELFTTVVDMLAALVHSTLISDSQSEKDECRKYYQNLIKKLKKELGDRHSSSIQFIRQLLLLPKRVVEVIACEPVGCVTDTKGNKITGYESIDKKQGLRVADKQRVTPWDLLEGQKNPAPLSWSWFGAVRLERKPLWYEDTHRLLKYHTHSLLKSPSHFIDPVPLPPEDLEPIQEKPRRRKMKAMCPPGNGNNPMNAGGPQMAMGHPGMNAQHAGNMGMGMQGSQFSNPVQMNVNMNGYMGNPNAGPGGAQQFLPGPGQNPQQTQQWGYQNAQQQQNYYNQMQIQRFERPPLNQSKQALSNMLRQRNPINPFMNPTGGPGPGPAPNMPNPGPGPAGVMQPGYGPMRGQQFPRPGIRPQMPPHAGPGGAMQGNQMFAGQQYGGPMQQGMGQNYGNVGYGNQQMVNPNAQMMAQQGPGQQPGNQMMGNFANQQGFNSQVGNAGMMARGAAAQNDYMAQQRLNQANRSQYMQAPNVTMNQMTPMGGNQNVANPMYNRGGTPGGPAGAMQGNPQFQQQQRIRQQMLAMQQQQQMNQNNQGGPGGPVGPGGPGAGPVGPGQQPTSALVAHLQRQMQQQQSSGQHNPYQQQPPPY